VIVPWYTRFLACPDCTAEITFDGDTVRCVRWSYNRRSSKPLDLRPTNPLRAAVTVARVLDLQAVLDQLDVRRPEITYKGPVALRDSSELLSALLPYLSPRSRILDLGCGPRDQAVPFEHLGHAYVAIDSASAAADLLGVAMEQTQCLHSGVGNSHEDLASRHFREQRYRLVRRHLLVA
jgi:hypothetical protein